jgi:hypothetical protein
MRPLAFAAAVRRKLLALPEFTPKPVCAACGHETEPGNFGREFCRPCEAERAAMSEMWEAERHAEANPSTSFAIPAEPMFDSTEAGKPFLADEDED